MIFVISPAKTLNYDKTEIKSHTVPEMLDQSKKLITILKKKNVAELMQLMDISEKLAILNAERYENFSTTFSFENAKQAILAFDGDVYDGLAASSFDEKELDYSQKHLRILSGLYGVLKPLDLMQPYRLEMGTALENPKGKNLYAFWGDSIAEKLNRALEYSGSKYIINLASNEYWSALQLKALKAEIIEIQFKEKRGDIYKVISFNAKKARGSIFRYAVKNCIEHPEDLKAFDSDDYRFNNSLSTEKVWVFTR